MFHKFLTVAFFHTLPMSYLKFYCRVLKFLHWFFLSIVCKFSRNLVLKTNGERVSNNCTYRVHQSERNPNCGTRWERCGMCPKRTGTITCPPTDRSSQTGEVGDRQRTRPRAITITQMGTALTTDTIKNLLNKVTKILLSFEIVFF